MMLSAQRVLAVFAHPDDEVLGCGGAMARLSAQAEVSVVILGEGITSRADARADADTAELARLADDARAANGVLGVQSVEVVGLPDNRFDTEALLDVVKVVEARIDNFRPELVFTHHPGDLNVDHLVTFRAVVTATRPTSAEHPVTDVLTCEIASSTEWAFGQFEPVFRPSVFLDVTDTIDRKIEAMETYASEARPAPHPRSPEKLRALAAWRGAAIGTEYAEAFEVVRSIARL